MTLHLAEIAQAVAPVRMRCYSWIRPAGIVSAKLEVPANITLVLLPPKLARTQPGREHLAVHARQLAVEPGLHILRRHRRPLLRGLEQLVDQPWTIMSIGMRDWAHGS